MLRVALWQPSIAPGNKAHHVTSRMALLERCAGVRAGAAAGGEAHQGAGRRSARARHWDRCGILLLLGR